MSAPIPAAASRPVSFGRTILQALKGEHHDYTSENLNRAVLLLAVPMVLEMLMESLFAITDVFWVSRLGREAVAVVGLTESIMTLIYAVAIGISIAATAIVARRTGEKDPKRAAHAAGQIILLGVTLAAVIGLVLGSLAPQLLRLMGAEPAVLALGSNFARVMLGGNATVFLIFLINAVFRGAGDAVLAMRTLWFANALNIILGPCFIFGVGPFPELGVTGAAVATNIGRGLGVCYQLWHLTGGWGRVHIRWQSFRPDGTLLWTILKTSGHGILQMLIATTSWLGLFKTLAVFGSAALAGYTIAIRIMMFAWMPAWGLANAGATLVGQNLGAKHPERAAQAVGTATKFNLMFLGGIGLLFIVFCRPIAGAFSHDPEVYPFAVRALWIISLAFPLNAIGMCAGAAFNGAGDTWTPTRINFFSLWLLQVPLAWLLAHPLHLGPLGVFIAVPVSFSIHAAWTWLLFKRGHWREKKI